MIPTNSPTAGRAALNQFQLVRKSFALRLKITIHGPMMTASIH
jgi:hypothetical protein